MLASEWWSSRHFCGLWVPVTIHIICATESGRRMVFATCLRKSCMIFSLNRFGQQTLFSASGENLQIIDIRRLHHWGCWCQSLTEYTVSTHQSKQILGLTSSSLGSTYHLQKHPHSLQVLIPAHPIISYKKICALWGNGYFWGCLNRWQPELRLRYGDGHEDVERSVRFFNCDGAVLRYCILVP